MNLTNIRDTFASLLKDKRFTNIDREGSIKSLTGNTTIEIVGASFSIWVSDDEVSLFGKVNKDYVEREEAWYNSMSLNVNDIPGGTPAIWKAVADREGFINSNYGWCIYSPNNLLRPENAIPAESGSEGYMNQFKMVVQELRQSPASRRALMIYTRPSMWLEYNKNGRSDFMCTNAVQYVIRNGALDAIVQMRSNDAIFGFKNDYAWQHYVLNLVAKELNIPTGVIYWQVGSLHVYERHYFLVDHYEKTGEIHITKEEYAELYPDSPYR